MNNNRLKTVTFTILFFFFIVTGKLFYLQIIQFEKLGQKIINQNYKASIITPQRGEIYDNQNNPLALNQTLYSVSLYKPDLKTNYDRLASLIKEIYPNLDSEDEQKINKFALNPNQKWLTLNSLFDNNQKQKISDPGISFSPVIKRFYPEGNLGIQIFGETSGLEQYYNKQLKGRPGFIWESKDATGKTLLTKSSWIIDPINGRDLHTTVNRKIQFIIERSIKEGVEKYSADSGSITIMSPETGGVIAMGSFAASSSATTNPIIANLFEPGSIFKPLVMSMAFDTNSITDNYICDKCGQPHQIGQYAISNWDNSFHPDSNLKDIIKNSDNIGMSYIIGNLGLNNFLRYFQLLGLDKKTGIDLPGEAKPIIKNYWPEIDLATASFGQGFAITQIQMITAFNSIANNGILVYPHLTDHFSEDGVVIPAPSQESISIYKPETINKIKQILKYSVENGVVAKFKPNDLEVCAKSGTSQIAVKGGYSDSSTIASYIGFSPCVKPKFTMIVTINNPRTSPWGSSTAAPIWYEIASTLDSLL